MISKRLQDAINAQINAEMWSAYLYLSMSAYCQDAGFSGIANWFSIQFKEEQDHAQILYNYLVSRGGRVILKPIDAVDTEWASPLAAFEHTYQHEQKVTGLIHNLMAMAVEENDYAMQSRMQWFIDEQVEEEEHALDLVNKLKMIGDNSYGLYQIDKELAARVYVQASPLSNTAD
ncbi:MAG: ferritin [Bacteroidaceae bacterium]|nr:ferritin [Bacteroidaceae bacterium]